MSEELGVVQENRTLQILAGNQIPAGAQPYAARYGGHQFGNWAGQLGDGRAITLGELIDTNNQSQEIQLKGAGPTPFSRRADGRAVLRSSLREYVASEVMHSLGVPTTRALALISTGEQVERDMFYDGRPQMEPGAIVTRVAPTFIRFGNFEIHAAMGETAQLNQLIDFTIENFYPQFWTKESSADYSAPPVVESRLKWFREVCTRTARMITEWQRVGFTHGVMNTDNMSILGLTIDYGPFGFLDNFDPQWTPNTTDAAQRRYRFENQPGIALWNLTRLAEALSLVIPSETGLQSALQSYVDEFRTRYLEMRFAKLGVSWTPQNTAAPSESAQAEQHLQKLDNLLVQSQADWTRFFLALEDHVSGKAELAESIARVCYKNIDADLKTEWQSWIKEPSAWQAPESAALPLMREHNPVLVPRNFLLQECIDEAHQQNYTKLELLMKAFENPYDRGLRNSEWDRQRPDWALNKAGCSQLSCSS